MLALVLLPTQQANAAPLRNVPQTVIQPDGEILHCFASVDEFFNYLHDEDGYIIIQDPKTGYYTYAMYLNKELKASEYKVTLEKSGAQFKREVPSSAVKISDIKIPFGVNVLWDPYASLDLAAATDAVFIREIMSGVYASDFGLWDTDSGEIARHRTYLGLKNLKMLYNIVPESAKYLADRDIAEIARTTVFNNKPDVICVSGITAGSAADTQVLINVKNAIPNTAVFANTGCNLNTIERILSIADGAVVGTTFKKDGLFDNYVDFERVKTFMDKVKSIRTL
jgi:membrane complex biogenesis BtpA family protein